MFYTSPPLRFRSELSAAVVVCEWKEKILLLKRSHESPQGGKWAAAGGKLEKGETPHDAAVRELYEETKIRVAPEELEFCFIGYFEFPDVQYVLHFFKANLLEAVSVDLDKKEHSEYLWISPEKALSMDLMRGASESLQKLYPQLEKSKSKRKESGTSKSS